ncbi:MAG: nitric oxide synthase [Betaproteobacteria bacterium]|nr:nitric oxide synthase [Betaproteobacteria bacterium]MSQ89240.1 nitric oxide synthase [Betaproteobacteria bacterium]
MELILLVGTMTGNAQLVAQELELVWDNGETKAQTLLMDQLDSSVFRRSGVFLIVTSTYGQGDVPDNAKALYEDLKAKRPDLSHVRYGIFGLGDRTYAETFNFGGKRFDDLLTELGAQRISERVQHDASSGTLPEEMAAEWGQGWLALAKEEQGQTTFSGT